MKCYICKSKSFIFRKGQVRDSEELKVLECRECSLVTLSSLDHISPGFYVNSKMHGDKPRSIDTWLKDTEWDDQRRFDMLKHMLGNKNLLDFGCGAGGFLSKARQYSASVEGVELEIRVQKYWRDKISIHSSVEKIESKYDLITAFHVIEHLPDPIALLMKLASKLNTDGRMVIEVPSSEDALLTLYESDAFQHFTYWSQHLFLFNPDTLKKVIELSGLRVLSIQQYQRYPLSNHLYWLSKNKLGGHKFWTFLDSHELQYSYGNALAAIGKCDTLIAHVERPD